MKISVSLKPSKFASDLAMSNVCFRVREKAIDIKVVSELIVYDKFWDMDTLSYKRNSVVPNPIPGRTSNETNSESESW
jgi:hypothetical protein